MLIACRSLPVLTVIVSLLLSSFTYFFVKSSRYSSSPSAKWQERYLGKDLAYETEPNATVQRSFSARKEMWSIVERSEPSFVVTASRSPSSMSCFLYPSFPESIHFCAQTISFCFWFAVAMLCATVELSTKTPGQRNRFAPEYAKTTTCSSSHNYRSIAKVGLRLES